MYQLSSLKKKVYDLREQFNVTTTRICKKLTLNLVEALAVLKIPDEEVTAAVYARKRNKRIRTRNSA